MDKTVKAAEKRVRKAEVLLYDAGEGLQAAVSELCVITGLGRQIPDLRKIRENVKQVMYSLASLRERGLCDLDSTSASALLKKGKRR